MRPVSLVMPAGNLSVLCLGAHSDDLEIGLGGLILEWIDSGVALDVRWCVLSATGHRGSEALASANAFLAGASKTTIQLGGFKDGQFPYQGEAIKAWLEGQKKEIQPDLIFTHAGHDAHQDHRMVCELTWNVFRDHLILEYEIPKWDGDLGRPNVYVPMKAGVLERKIGFLQAHFRTQRSKDWFDERTFRGLARLRGMECRGPDGYAEAFFVKKMVLAAMPGAAIS